MGLALRRRVWGLGFGLGVRVAGYGAGLRVSAQADQRGPPTKLLPTPAQCLGVFGDGHAGKNVPGAVKREGGVRSDSSTVARGILALPNQPAQRPWRLARLPTLQQEQCRACSPPDSGFTVWSGSVSGDNRYFPENRRISRDPPAGLGLGDGSNELA